MVCPACRLRAIFQTFVCSSFFLGTKKYLMTENPAKKLPSVVFSCLKIFSCFRFIVWSKYAKISKILGHASLLFNVLTCQRNYCFKVRYSARSDIGAFPTIKQIFLFLDDLFNFPSVKTL